jgi:hypothetical protein
LARIREYEEIITLQDKAIEALKQANRALEIALSTLERARNEHGYPQKFDFGPQPDQVYDLTKYGGAVGGLGVYNNGMSVSQANTQASNLSAVEQMYYQKKLAESAQFMLEP